MNTTVTDIHTHRPTPGAIVNINPGEPILPDLVYSTGFHPWGNFPTPADWDTLEQTASHPSIAAIGECGIDALRGAPADIQQEIFERQAILAESLHKPLIIHCVRSMGRILEVRKKISAGTPWIWHGFRGSPQQAAQLLRAGIHMSLGPRFNPDTATMLPDSEIFLETDDSGLTIEEVAARIAAIRNASPAQMLEISASNIQEIL